MRLLSLALAALLCLMPAPTVAFADADVTATINGVDDTSVSFTITATESATIYFTVLPATTPEPSVPADMSTWTGASYSGGRASLMPETAYNLWYMAEIGEWSSGLKIEAFTTTAGTMPSDTTAPTVASVTPSGAGAAISGNVSITFSEQMDSATIGTVTLSGGGSTITPAGSQSWSIGDTVYSRVYSGLAPGTVYTVTISGFKDSAGNEMLADNSHTFTTADTIPPTISDLALSTGSPPTATTATFILRLSEYCNLYLMVYAAADTAPDAATIKAQGTAVWKRVWPDMVNTVAGAITPLTPDTSYVLYAVAEDAAGNTSAVVSLSFATVAEGGSYTDASLSQTSAAFDKYAQSAGYKDVTVTLNHGSYALSAIKHGSATLVSGTDYTVLDSAITIKKEYLATLGTGAQTLTFDMSGGTDPVLTITVSDATPDPANPTDPDPTDSTNPDPTDSAVSYPILQHYGEWSGSGHATAKIDGDHTRFVRLTKGEAVVDAAHYTITQDSTVITLKESYLKTLAPGTHAFVAHYSDGKTDDIILTVKAASGTKPDTGVLPQTGEANTLVWLVVLAASALGGLCLLFIGRRERRARVR
jgi:LPXTG-motif cell wall-anchored protein